MTPAQNVNFTPQEGARLLLNVMKLSPFRQILDETEKADLNIHKKLEQDLVQANKLNGSPSHGLVTLVFILLGKMRAIVPLEFQIEEKRVAPSLWSPLCFTGRSRVKQGVINVG